MTLSALDDKSKEPQAVDLEKTLGRSGWPQLSGVRLMPGSTDNVEREL